MADNSEPFDAEPSGNDAAAVSYLLSFDNEQRFLVRQGIALLLIAAAGFIELASVGHLKPVWHALTAALALTAISILATALRRFEATEQNIRDTYWTGVPNS